MRAYKTKVELKLQGTSLVYWSSRTIDQVVIQIMGGKPIFLETYDGQCVMVNPAQCPAIEVYAVEKVAE